MGDLKMDNIILIYEDKDIILSSLRGFCLFLNTSLKASLSAYCLIVFGFSKGWKFWLHNIFEHILRGSPEKDSAFITYRNNGLLIWRYLNFSDGSRMTLSFIITDSFIIIPDSKKSILTASNKMFALLCNTNSIQLFLRPFDRTYNLSIILFPVSNLPI